MDSSTGLAQIGDTPSRVNSITGGIELFIIICVRFICVLIVHQEDLRFADGKDPVGIHIEDPDQLVQIDFIRRQGAGTV